MLKKAVIFLLYLLFVSTALSETHWFSDEDGNDHSWNRPGNWWQSSVPTVNDVTYINRPTKYCVVDSSVFATCSELGVGNDKGPAGLVVTGGTIAVASQFRIGINVSSYGTVDLDSGSISCGNFIIRQNGGVGTFDIEEGMLVVDGNLVSRIQGYVDNGWVKAYSGNGQVIIDYDNINPGKTTVSAVRHVFVDFDKDGLTTFRDYSSFLSAWLCEALEPDYNEVYDLEDDNSINIFDLKFVMNDWLKWPGNEVAITVDANNVQHTISEDLTGYHTIYSHEDDHIWADGNIVEYLRDINAGVGRYPGGAVVSYWHWDEPTADGWYDSWNPSFNGDYGDPNDFMDLNEFMAKCTLIGNEPIIGINIQSGIVYNRLNESIADAAALVQFCKDQGHNVKYWYIDNEPYLDNQSPAMTGEEYGGYINQFVPAMKAVDPNIKIVANWKSGFFKSWGSYKNLLNTAGDNIDVIDVHWYWDWGNASWFTWLRQNPMRWENQWTTNGHSFVEEIEKFRSEVNEMNYGHIELVSFEWNIGPNDDELLSPFQYALMQSEMLGQFIEGDLFMSILWTLQWPVPDQGTASFANRYFLNPVTYEPNPIYEIYRMYSKALGQQFVTSQTDVEHVRPVSVLSNDGNTLWVYLLHKSEAGTPITARLGINNFNPSTVEVTSFMSGELSSDTAQVKKRLVFQDSQSGKWTVPLPAASFTMLTFQK